MRRFILILAVAALLQAAEAEAASLYGRVIEVNSGDVITVFNLNRPVRVKLLGVDAPEMNQTFGDVARKHLSDLVFDKSVVVEYYGLGADRSLAGKVSLNAVDVGAQMIRDGAAWFDPANVSRLSETDREIYQQSEQAARGERRGLWQADNPTAPWEFVRAEALRRNPRESLNAMFPRSRARTDGSTPELTNLSLIAERSAAAASQPTRILNTSDLAGQIVPVVSGSWRALRPAGENFSVLVPDGGMMDPVERDGVFANAYLGRDGWNLFEVIWLTAPTNGETDKSAISQTFTEFIKGFGQSYSKHDPVPGVSYACELTNEKDISTDGYTGSEFDLSSCTIRGHARVFTKVVGSRRRMYIATAFYLDDDPNVARFIKSFTIVSGKNVKSRK